MKNRGLALVLTDKYSGRGKVYFYAASSTAPPDLYQLGFPKQPKILHSIKTGALRPRLFVVFLGSDG